MKETLKRIFLLWSTLGFGLLLSLLPVPEMLEPFRPDWVTAILVYWVIALPHRVSVGYAWCMGLFLDVLLGSTMGLRAFSLSIVAYIASVQCQRLRNYSVGQQAIVIGLLVLLSKLLTLWAEHTLKANPVTFYYLWSVVSTMLLWPWIFFILRKIRRQLQLS